MKSTSHILNRSVFSLIGTAFSTAWGAINQFNLSKSELNARVRYAVADQIAEEFAKKNPQVVLAGWAKKHTNHPGTASNNLLVKSYKKSTEIDNSWMLVECSCKGQNENSGISTAR